MNKLKKSTKIIDQYSIKCPLCEKVIFGYNPSHCDKQLQAHYYYKHR